MSGAAGGKLTTILTTPCRYSEPVHTSFVSTFDLAKATLLCGSIAYFAYRIPVVSQALIIAILSLLWLTYFH